MKVLFIGGTGIISSACTELAIKRGIELYHLNRGTSISTRPTPAEVKHIYADIRNHQQSAEALKNYSFDVVVDWISFVPEHIGNNLRLLKDKTNQYIFISSASAYQTPPQKLPVTENTPLENAFWQYSRDKIACEKYLIETSVLNKIKYTIVRPSHTYDKTLIPLECGYTVINRMKQGKPVVVHGDGTSIWTLTHHRDFAKGLLGLLGNIKAMDNIFHITSDEWLSWNQIYLMLGEAFGLQPRIVHVPSEIIARYDSSIGSSLLGDKTHSMIFDNSKIKDAVPDFNCEIPFSRGAKEIAAWYEADTSRQIINNGYDSIFDQLVSDYCK